MFVYFLKAFYNNNNKQKKNWVKNRKLRKTAKTNLDWQIRQFFTAKNKKKERFLSGKLLYIRNHLLSFNCIHDCTFNCK